MFVLFQVDESDPFDTTMVGPWMGQWELINHNKHTTNFKYYDYSKDRKIVGPKTRKRKLEDKEWNENSYWQKKKKCGDKSVK